VKANEDRAPGRLEAAPRSAAVNLHRAAAPVDPTLSSDVIEDSSKRIRGFCGWRRATGRGKRIDCSGDTWLMLALACSSTCLLVDLLALT
jgi:hypothetical protein